MEQVGVQAGGGLQFWRSNKSQVRSLRKNPNSSGRGAWCEDHHQELLLLPRKPKIMSPVRAVCGLGSICSVSGDLQLDGAVRR